MSFNHDKIVLKVVGHAKQKLVWNGDFVIYTRQNKNNMVEWVCYFDPDGIEGVGATPAKAYAKWLKNTKQAERGMCFGYP